MGIKYAENPWNDEEILKTLKPYVAKWFKQTFETFTPPQKYAIPLIQKGENTLVFSPTGSGKCITPDQKVLVKIDGLVYLLKGEELIQMAKTEGKTLQKIDNGILYEIPSLKVFSLKENKIVESPAYIYIEDYNGEIIEIETEAGRKIKVTPNHPLLKEDIDGTWRWTPAEKLKVGDRIAVAREINYKSSIKKLKLKESLKALKTKFKEVLTYKDFLKLRKRIDHVGFKKLSLEELNQVRIFCKLKYTKIAKETGIGLTTVWNFFRGKTIYKKDLILKILRENFPNSVEENRIFILGRNGDIISFKYPKKIDEKLVKWVAFVLSEGHIQASSRDNFIDFMMVAQAKNKKLLKEFLSITKELFDVEFRKKDEINWVLNSRAFLEFISVYLDLQPNSRERRKKMPEWILSLDKPLMRIFLRWFFTLDAEVRDQIVLFQASEDIIDKIAYMLLRFGIFPSLNVKYKFASNTTEKKKRKYYSVSIFGIRNLRKFDQEIGLEREPPASYINLLKAKPSGEHVGKFHLNFKEISEIRKILGCSWHDEFEKRYGNIYEVVRRTGMITLGATQKLQELLKQDLQKLSFNGNIKLIDSLRKILGSEIFFLKIKKITKIHYEGKLLDFTVPKLRNFIGGKGAVVLHNTLAAFLFAINWLFGLGEEGKLEDTVYVVYVSPLRALANDIRKNLLVPLEGIREVANGMGLELPEIRAFVRTGDTPASEKAKMLKKPPHILITTPETLSIVLCAPRFREKLKTVRYVIVDEVHELCDNKRGVHLSLSLERLREIAEQEFVRIGLSATQAPLEEIAKWLVGYRENEKLRDVTIVNIYETKKLDMRVICPVRDLIHTDYAYVNARMYEILRDLVEKHRTTLIFTNTRSGAESVTFHLKQVFGEEYIDQIATHHGSLSRTTRLEVEDLLKQGQLKAVICVSEDSRILTNHYWKPIIEVKPQDKVVYLDDQLKLKEGTFAGRVSVPYYDEGFMIKSRLGFEIKCTKEHKFLTIRRSKLTWIEAKDLKVGDKVAVIRKIPTFQQKIPSYYELIPENAYVWLEENFLKSLRDEIVSKFNSIKHFCKLINLRYSTIKENLNGTYPIKFANLMKILKKLERENEILEEIKNIGTDKRKYNIPNRKISKDFIRFLGFWLAEGSWDASGISIAGNENLLKYYSSLLTKEFPVKFIKDKNPYGIPQIKFYSTLLLGIFKKLTGTLHKKSLYAKFPTILYELPSSYKWAFLSGYFDGDGYLEVKSGRIYSAGFTTFNLNLAKGMQNLLLQLGVIASIRKKEYNESREFRGRKIRKRGTCYTVSIYGGENLRIFATNIDPKREEFSKIKRVCELKGYCNRDVVPGMGEILRKTREEAGISTYKLQKLGYNPVKVELEKREIRRENLKKLAEIYKESNHSYLLRILSNSDVFWDEIIEKKPLKLKQVYSLVDTTNHNYVIEGFICRNSSTSLELGIDIGYIDLVVQIGSPKSVAKGLQRVGRAGHFLHEVSKGRLIVFDRDDLVECTVLVKAAYEGKIDRVQIPKNCLDVLAQHLVGMSVNKKWKVDEAYKLIKRSYCYHNLSKKDFIEVLRYLGGHYVHLEDRGVYRKLWYDEEEGVFGRKRAARMIYFMNIGTIPDEADFRVILEDQRTTIGRISEKFLERLTPGDIFVLGGKTYQYLRTRESKVFVRSAYGRRPTVPQWIGEMLPRSFDLSIEVGKFRELITEKLRELPVEEVKEWLKKEYYLDEAAANSLIQYFIEQLTYAGKVASHRKIILEEFFDERGRQNIVFHAPFGRRTNDALSRAYAYQVSKLVKANVATTVTDDGFMLILPYGKVVDLREIPPLVTSKNLIEVLKKAIRNTELFKRRFQHVAARSFMILRKYKGYEISLSKQQFRASKILDLIADWEDFPIIKETYREILEDVFDVENAKKVLQWIEEGKTVFDFLPAMEIPSPFAHGTILVGISDIVMMEDRQALLKELHQKILEKIQRMPATITIERRSFETIPESIVSEFLKKRRMLTIRTKEDIIKILHEIGAIKPSEIKKSKHFEIIISGTEDSSKEKMWKQIKNWILKLEEEGKIIQVPCLKGMTLHYITVEDYPIYATAYQESVKIKSVERKILDYVRSYGGVTADQIAETLQIEKKEVNRALKKLEKAYILHRKKQKTKKETKRLRTAWYIAEEILPRRILIKTAKMNKAEAQKQIILKFLHINGPSTFKEITDYTGFPQDEISKILSILEAEDMIERGKFVDYKPTPQVIIKEDLEELRRLSEIIVEKKIIPTEILEAYYMKIQHLTEDTKGFTESDILKILADCGPMYTLVNRTPTLLNRMKIPREEIEKLIKKLWKEKKIFWIRCLREMKALWIIDKEYPLFYKLYAKQIKLNDIDQKILNEIRENGPVATHILARKLKIKTGQLRASLQKLERSYKIIRVDITTDEKGRPAILWDTAEKFVPKHLLKEAKKISIETALKKLIIKFLHINGPSTIDEICGWIGFPEDKIKPLLNELQKEKITKHGMFTRTKIATQWILTEDLEKLFKPET